MKKTLRGKELEHILNKTNTVYKKQKVAVIHNLKQPVKLTSRGIVPVSSPTDYMGFVKGGMGVTYDAKETIIKTRFPLDNIHDHQLNFLALSEELGVKAGFIVWFKSLGEDEVYFMPASFVRKFKEESSRSSIPYKSFKKSWKINLSDYLNLLHG